MADDKEFFSVMDVAKKFGVSKDTVYRLIHKGELPYYQIGGAIRIKKEDVEDYLKRAKK
jgi:excisionase family DNA binding protein